MLADQLAARLALAKFETLAYTLANEKRKALVDNWLWG